MTKVTERTRFRGRKLAALLVVGAAFGVATCLANPFDDVKYMFSGGVDADGNGILTHNSSELRCITKAGDPTHAWHTTKYADSTMSLCELQNLNVPCTYAGMTLANAPCLYFPQSVTTNGWEDITINDETVSRPNITVRSNYLNLPNLLSDWTGDRANRPCSNYTFIARLRRDDAVDDNNSMLSNFLHLGYTWASTSGNGISVTFVGGTGVPSRNLRIMAGGQYWDHSSWQKVPDGAWCEIAVVVTAPKLEAAICMLTNNVATPLQWGAKTYDAAYNCAILPDKRIFKLAGESSGTLTFTRGTNPNNNKAKGFRGAIHTFAFWDRALTREEVQEALAASRPGVVKQGFKNGSSDEFTKAQDSITEGVRWEEWNPVLNAAHPSASVTFKVNTMYGGLPQYLFLTPVPTGADGTLDITIDGNRVAMQHFATGRTGVVYVPGSFLAAGSHTIAFRRTDTGGDFAIDAFEIRGSWQVGYDWKGGADAAFVTETGSNHTLYLTDGNSKHLKRGYTSATGQHTTWLYFDVPRELCDAEGRCRVDATLYTRTDQGDPNALTHTFDLLVNGQTFDSDVIWRAYNIAPENSPTRFTHTIPAGVLTNGMNCVAWHKTSSARWIKCACYRLTFDKIPSGTMVIFR